MPKPKRVSWKLKDLAPALKIILKSASPITEYEELPLHECAGRVLAMDVNSSLKLPPVDRSERDGYALRSADCAQANAELEQIGEATAGHPFTSKLKPGTCVRIATGAVIPAGADAVVMFEDAEAGSADRIKITQSVAKHQWIARAGSDYRQGQRIKNSGDLLSPASLTGIGSLGIASLQVFRKPRAAVFTTGDEVKKPGQELGPGDVYDGNTAGLVALLRAQGIDAQPQRTVPDTLSKLSATLQKLAGKFDLIVFTGGTSVGDRDFGRPALDAVGQTLVHGLNLKPGKPLLAGMIGSTSVIGLPGFPTSALIVAYSVLIPLARRLAGAPLEQAKDRVVAKLAEDVKPDRLKTFAIPMRFNAQGELESCFKGSAQVSTLAAADAILTLDPGEKSLPAGSIVSLRLT